MYDDEGDRVSAPFGFRSASSDGSFFSKKKKKRNVLIPGRSSVSDGRSQPADLSSGCISLP